MSLYAKEKSTGHSVLGAILGLIGILLALVLVYLTGVIGAAISVVLGVIALALGIQARRGGRGWGAIILGVLSILMAAVMLVVTVSALQLMRERAAELGNAPLVVKYLNKPYLGLTGMVVDAAQDASEDPSIAEQLREQMDLVTQSDIKVEPTAAP